MKRRAVQFLPLLGLVFLAVLAIPSRLQHTAAATNTALPPPPPPTVGEFGGPLAGLTSTQTGFFTGGYGLFAIKWDPIRGLGPVSTQTGCFTCHGAGVDVLTGTAGDTSALTGQRYGKWNSDGTFNYLDGNGTFPENEGGPIVHGVSNAAFGTLPGCNIMNIATSNGATESGTTVTITTNAAHKFAVGQYAMINKVPVSGYNGTFQIVSIPSTTTFTYTATTSGLAPSGGGTAQNLPHEVVPADATVVSLVRSPNLFGLGLVDNIPDSAILANVGNPGNPYGINGQANMVPDENGNVRPGKFGQKLNVVSLFQFTANAEFNELGITNSAGPFGTADQFFPTEHLPQGLPYPSACQDDPNSPQDVTQTNMIKMTQFQALLAPIPPQPPTSATEAGATVFINIGCSVCHIESFTTKANVTLNQTEGRQTGTIEPLSNVTFNPYSDFLLHNMGSGDSGGIPFQPNNIGQASLTQWRTAPLWGLSNTLTKAGGLMHDNASTSITAAILRHGGEAAPVISNYQALDSTDSSNLLAFLNSL
jgi:di-heme oxidoreductase (putative peroxidase)